jgi:flavodoxin
MQALVAYYSRTGHTKKVGEEIAKELQCDVEELADTVDRSGPSGFIISGREGMQKSLTKLKPLQKDPAKYDIVIIGTPVWSLNMSSPTRTYMAENKDRFRKVAFFCTEGTVGEETTFKDMAKVSGKKPEATLAIKARDISRGSYPDKVKKFAMELKGK